MTAMTKLGNACVLTRRETGYEFDEDRADAIIAGEAAARERWRDMYVSVEGNTSLMSPETSGYVSGAKVVSGSTWYIKQDIATHNYWVRTKATSVTSTTVSTVGMLLRASRRDEMLKRLSPERRATFDRIRRLREEIGPVSFNIVRELRELRSHG
jgi:hypothetical protein